MYCNVEKQKKIKQIKIWYAYHTPLWRLFHYAMLLIPKCSYFPILPVLFKCQKVLWEPCISLFTDRPIPVIKLLNSNLACTAFIIKKSIAYQNLCTWPFRMFQFFTPPSFYYRTLVYIMIASKTNNVASRYGHRKCVNILIIEYAFFNFIKEDLVSQHEHATYWGNTVAWLNI